MVASPRSAYAAKRERSDCAILELLTRLNQNQLTWMEAAFQERCGSLGLAEFISILKQLLPFDDSDEILSSSVELFREIDMNGDGVMDWEELMRFIVEKARLEDTEETVSHYHYQALPSENSATAARHRNLIDRIVPIPDHQLFAVIEQHSNTVHVYHARSGEWYASIRTKAVPMSLCYVESEQTVLVACSDMTMTSLRLDWDHFARVYRFRETARWSTPETIMSMCWADQVSFMYSGNTAGIVHAWQLHKGDGDEKDQGAKKKAGGEGSEGIVKQFSEKFALEGHSDIVMELLHIRSIDSLASASLDSTVRLWDTYTEKQSTSLKGHTKGVNALTYNQEHRFLLSSGFDHDAFVWSPFSSSLLFRLKGHRAALVGCHTVEGTHEVITGDCDGFLKLWDLRTFKCVQTFTTRSEAHGDLEDLQGFQAFAHLKLPPLEKSSSSSSSLVLPQVVEDFRIVAGTKKLFFFDQRRVRKESVTDSAPLRLVILNEVSLTIFVVSERTVKIWDAIKGTLKRTFANVSRHDVSAACLDDRRRKFFLGDAHGCIACHNYQNGAFVKAFEPLSSPVAALCYLARAKALVAAAASGAVRVYDEKDPENCRILRSFEEAYTHRSELKLLAVHANDEMHALAATAADVSSEGVRVWDSYTAKCECIVRTPNAIVLALGFLAPTPLLYVCTSDGFVRVWVVRPFGKLRNGTCVASFPNKPPPGSSYNFSDAPTHSTRPVLLPPSSSPGGRNLPPGVCTKPTPASAAAWDETTQRLVLGDELGNLRCYDLGHVLERLDDVDRVAVDNRRSVVKPHELRLPGFSKVESAAPSYLELVECSSEEDERKAAAAVENALFEAASFRWGVEYAHDDAILSVTVAADPKCVLSAGIDRCVRLWATETGDFRGLLLQSVSPGATNPYWSLDLDVAAREAAEMKETERVKEMMEQLETKEPQVVEPSAENVNRKPLKTATVDESSSSFSRPHRVYPKSSRLQPSDERDRLRARVQTALVDAQCRPKRCVPGLEDGLCSLGSTSYHTKRQERRRRRLFGDSHMLDQQRQSSSIRSIDTMMSSLSSSSSSSALPLQLKSGPKIGNCVDFPANEKSRSKKEGEERDESSSFRKMRASKSLPTSLLSVVPKVPKKIDRLSSDAQESLGRLVAALDTKP